MLDLREDHTVPRIAARGPSDEGGAEAAVGNLPPPDHQTRRGGDPKFTDTLTNMTPLVDNQFTLTEDTLMHTNSLQTGRLRLRVGEASSQTGGDYPLESGP